MKNRRGHVDTPGDSPERGDEGAEFKEGQSPRNEGRRERFYEEYGPPDEPEQSPIPEEGRPKWTLPLCFFVWSLFQPVTAAYVYMAVIGIFMAFLMLLIAFGKPKLNPAAWTEYEIEIIYRYNLAVEYPDMAAWFSGVLGGFRCSGIIWIPWLLWNHLWLLSICLPLMGFLSWPFSMRLDPLHYIGESIEYGHKKYLKELAALMVIRRKFKPIQTIEKDRE